MASEIIREPQELGGHRVASKTHLVKFVSDAEAQIRGSGRAAHCTGLLLPQQQRGHVGEHAEAQHPRVAVGAADQRGQVRQDVLQDGRVTLPDQPGVLRDGLDGRQHTAGHVFGGARSGRGADARAAGVDARHVPQHGAQLDQEAVGEHARPEHGAGDQVEQDGQQRQLAAQLLRLPRRRVAPPLHGGQGAQHAGQHVWGAAHDRHNAPLQAARQVRVPVRRRRIRPGWRTPLQVALDRRHQAGLATQQQRLLAGLHPRVEQNTEAHTSAQRY